MIIDKKSGLYLPKKRRELWPNDDARKFGAVAKMLKARESAEDNVEVQLAIICVPCNAVCTPGKHEVTGEITLECGCTVRVMEGLR